MVRYEGEAWPTDTGLHLVRSYRGSEASPGKLFFLGIVWVTDLGELRSESYDMGNSRWLSFVENVLRRRLLGLRFPLTKLPRIMKETRLIARRPLKVWSTD